MFKYDVFISHASEDKDLVARPISNALSKYGLNVWFDEMTLSIGDSLSRSIDRGLSESEYGIIILSPAFFAKNWPEYELRGLNAKEIRGKKVILPLWHNVDIDEVIRYSPSLADKLALSTQRNTSDEIALKLIEAIRPDIFTKIHKRLNYLESVRESKNQLVNIPTKEITFGPPKHQELPDSLVARIRLIRAALLGVHTHSMNYWIDGFRLDSHPSKEIHLWERLAACYLEYIQRTDLQTSEQHQSVYNVLFKLSMGTKEEELKEDLSILPDDAFRILSNLSQYKYPLFDSKEEFPISGVSMTVDEHQKWLTMFDDIEDYTSLDRHLAD